MAENKKWNPRLFAKLLTEAKGIRSWRQFAIECDISYVQMRKLAEGEQENPPRPKLIQKVANNAFNDVDLEDLMYCAGITLESPKSTRENGKGKGTPYEKYRALPPKKRKMVDKFIEFLANDKED